MALPLVKAFWDSLVAMIRENCPHAHNLTLNEIFIIFGNCDQIVSDRGLDMIILWAKFYIFKSKNQRIIPNTLAFKTVLKSYVHIEKYLAKMNDKEINFYKIWNPYLPLLN